MEFKDINSEHILKEHEELFNEYADLLIEWNEKINLTAIREKQDIIHKHFLDSLLLVPFLPTDTQSILDIGSGAGFPGLPLAIAFSKINVSLIESITKKALFLRETVKTLELNNVTVINDRAETLGQTILRESFDVVTARAVTALPALLELTLPFLKIGGSALLFKHPDEDVNQARVALETLGGVLVDFQTLHNPHGDIPRGLVIIKKKYPTPKSYPRTPGIPVKKPLI